MDPTKPSLYQMRVAAAFERLGIAELASNAIETADAEHLLEWAKHEIDFVLEKPF